MVAGILISALLLVTTPLWGGEPLRQLCLSCHAAHHTERGGCPDCHHGNPASARKNIAHSGLISGKYASFSIKDSPRLTRGKLLMEQFACRRCHVSDARGNRCAVSLDRAAAGRNSRELASSIRRPVEGMPDFGLDEERIACLVTAILAGSQGRDRDTGGPLAVRFSSSGEKKRDVFSDKCGSCHRLLSEQRGALGTGRIGPDLSGLLSIYYPKSFRGGEAWSLRHLETWLKNPREIRLWATMLPVRLSEDEFRELQSVLETGSQQ